MTSAQDLVALRSFLAIYRTGGVAKAAEALHISQPAVSHHLRAIEEIAERPLFMRSGRGIAATEAGHALAAQIAGHMDHLEEALDALRPQVASQAGPVFVGAPADQLDGYVLSRLVPLFDQGLAVHCRVGMSTELVDDVLCDEIDVAVITKIEGVPTKRLHLLHCHDEEFVLIGRADQEPYDPHGPQVRRFVGFSEAMPMARRYFRSCWGMTPPTPTVTVPDMRAVVSTVSSSTLLSVVPRYLAQRHIDAGALAVLHRPRAPVVNPIYAATRRGRQHLRHISAVFEHVRAP
ncbi:LysR family transcriptional regulator [Nonomuraea lactucae]|uniref:LysR family transcriptional regulator n=1 Tax=Nonomuraea lactucae TaxID=2249762 RepID=UPI000DE4BF61|nr:LysR family transcriptional regulator [Nonomuraea lactucae]